MDTAGWNSIGVAWRWRWEHVWWWILVLAGCLLMSPTVDGQEYFARGCPGGEADSPPVEVTLSCPEGQVISLGEAKFGRSKYKTCTITDGDCLDRTDAFVGCKGRHTCTVHFDRPFSPTCGYATFITVTYDCRAVTSPPPTSSTVQSSQLTSRITQSPPTTSRKTDTTRSDLGPSGQDNAALIAGCVVAVVITVILLIIAIVMVVRRLTCASDLAEEEEKKSSACTIFPCVSPEHSSRDTASKPRQRDEADHGHSNSGGGGSGSEDDDKSRSKRKRKQRGWWADKNQNMSSPRLAPVGQEDEEEQQQGQGTMSQNRSAPPLASSAQPGPAQPARVSVYSEVVGGAGASSPSSSGRSSLAMDGGPQLKRNSSGAKCAGSDFVRDQGGVGVVESSEMEDLSGRRGGGGGEGKGSGRRGVQGVVGGSRSGSGRMNNDIPCSPAQDKRATPVRVQKVPADNHAAAKASKQQQQRCQYDAVAVPNTETFTAC